MAMKYRCPPRGTASGLAAAILPIVAILAALLAVTPGCVAQQQQVKRLILKDGTDQLVTKYEVKGDRVRYYSSEREEWEELPNSLVDWPATEKYEREHASAAPAPEAVQLDKEIAREDERAEALLPEVAPGLRLPEDSGVFLFDSFEGQPQLVELQQTAGDVNQNKKTNILRSAIPMAGQKATIEIDGAHAKMQSHVGVPSLYLSVEPTPEQMIATSISDAHPSNAPVGPEKPQQPQQAAVPYDRFLIVHTEIKGNKRVVGEVKRAVTGKVAQEQHSVKTTIDRVAGGWLKITPTEPLPAGEYALVEMGTDGMNLDVWDFGVNPKAPANANPWKPDSKPVAKPDSKPDTKPAAPETN
jgi:hypothetical protein